MYIQYKLLLHMLLLHSVIFLSCIIIFFFVHEMDDLFDKVDWANIANNASLCELCLEKLELATQTMDT
jgi:hypothetical protein